MMYILAQRIDRDFYLKSMHHQFSKPNPDLGWQILMGVLLVGGLVGIAILIGIWQRRRKTPNQMAPLSLYRQALVHIGLATGDMWRLWRLAKGSKLAHPAAMLISPELFDETVAAYCAGSGWFGSRARQADAFAAIRKRLFNA